jgi:hypothetical protein
VSRRLLVREPDFSIKTVPRVVVRLLLSSIIPAQYFVKQSYPRMSGKQTLYFEQVIDHADRRIRTPPPPPPPPHKHYYQK